MYHFMLVNIMAIAEFGEGEPPSWCIANHEGCNFIVVFFEQIIMKSGEVKPTQFMSDLASQLFATFVDMLITHGTDKKH